MTETLDRMRAVSKSNDSSSIVTGPPASPSDGDAN